MGSLYWNPTETVEWVDRFESYKDTVLKERKETILLRDFNKDPLRVDTNREWLIFTESLVSVSEQDSLSRLRINETTSNLSISRV